MRAAEGMIALLRSLLCGIKPDRELWDGITEKLLPEVCELSARHDLGHLVALALDEAGRLKTDDLGQALRKQQYMAVWRYENQQFEYRRICDVFERAGIDYVPLKGAVIRTYYPEPWMRTSCDIDILVREEELNRAVQVLVEQLHYRKEQDAYHDVSLFSESGVHLELHFNLKENMERLDVVLSRVWENVQPVDGSHQYRMTSSFLMFHILAHMAYHFFHGGCGVRTVMDCWLLKRNMPYDEARVRSLCEEAGLLRFYESVFAAARVWFEGECPDELVRDVQEYILCNGVYGTKRAAAGAVRSREGSRAKYWLRRVFLPREILLTQYPGLKKHPLLYPYYQMKRWCKIFRKASAQRVVNEFRLNQDLTEDELEHISALLTRLKLL